jgi:uncharacterized membrane protein (DUF485 family)
MRSSRFITQSNKFAAGSKLSAKFALTMTALMLVMLSTVIAVLAFETFNKFAGSANVPTKDIPVGSDDNFDLLNVFLTDSVSEDSWVFAI